MHEEHNVRIVAVVGALALLLAGCSGDDGTAGGDAETDDITTTEATTEPAATEEQAAGNGGRVQQASATLAPLADSGVTGEATLVWDQDTGVLAVTLDIAGLEGGERYAAVISPGCEEHSGLVHQAGTVTADADGNVTLTTEVKDVNSVDFDGGWAVRVVQPPGGPRACGEVGQA